MDFYFMHFFYNSNNNTIILCYESSKILNKLIQFFFISSLISSCSFITLFIKTNWSWPITESIEALEISMVFYTFMVFNLNFANNTTFSCFFFFFLIIDLFALIAGVIAQIFNPIAELITAIGIPTKEAKKEMETHLVILEAKIST